MTRIIGFETSFDKDSALQSLGVTVLDIECYKLKRSKDKSSAKKVGAIFLGIAFSLLCIGTFCNVTKMFCKRAEVKVSVVMKQEA